MAYKITGVQSKSPDWKVVSLITPDGKEVGDVSVNRTNKKNEVFPNFDAIVEGADIEGTLWASATGKQYLFAPKAPLQRPKFMGGGTAAQEVKGKQIEKAQETTFTHVKEAQDRKQDAIILSAAQRDAVLMVTTFEVAQPFPTDAELRAKIIEWREWFLKEHKSRADLPF